MSEASPISVSETFFKGHGLGNDYLVMNEGGPIALVPGTIEALCDRWRGVGADGIVVLLSGDFPPWPLRMFNPDGSEFERSGNGLRILACYLARAGLVNDASFAVQVGGDQVEMTVHSKAGNGIYDVSVAMGQARFGPGAVGLDGGLDDPRLCHPELGPLEFQPVSVGNPHAVLFTDDLSPGYLEAVGSFLAVNPAFRRGTNVQCVRPVGHGRLELRIWERGVGSTAASGTSACAVAAAAVFRGIESPGALEIDAPGGTLAVTVGGDFEVTLRGPVQAICDGRLDPGWIAGLPSDGD